MKRIFLTGSKGFIGSHLLKALSGYNVHCAEHNELPKSGVYYDYIIHLAGTTTTSDQFNPELFENNIVYAKQIMSYPFRTIYASSTSAAELTNPYSYTKRYIEYLGSKHPNATGLRFFNVYGPGNNKGIIKKAIECANSGEVMDLYGAYNFRDFIYIDDVVKCIIDSLDSEENIIEVGTGKCMTIDKAIQAISRIMAKPIKHRLLSAVKTDMKHSVANPGMPNCLSFEDGIKKMLAA